MTACVEWGGAVTSTGYGLRTIKQRQCYVHRLAWEEAHGRPVPQGFIVHHLCGNRLCVNPEHLEAIEHGEHTRLHAAEHHHNRAKTHCPQGHPYAGENLMVCRRGNGQTFRACRACRRAQREGRSS